MSRAPGHAGASPARAPYQGPPRYYTRPLAGTFHRIYALLDEYGYVIAETISCPDGIEVPMPAGTRPLRWKSPSDAMREASGVPTDARLLLYRNKVPASRVAVARVPTFMRAPKNPTPPAQVTE